MDEKNKELEALEGEPPARVPLNASIFKTRCAACGQTLWASSKERARQGGWSDALGYWLCPRDRKPLYVVTP